MIPAAVHTGLPTQPADDDVTVSNLRHICLAAMIACHICQSSQDRLHGVLYWVIVQLPSPHTSQICFWHGVAISWVVVTFRFKKGTVSTVIPISCGFVF